MPLTDRCVSICRVRQDVEGLIGLEADLLYRAGKWLMSTSDSAGATDYLSKAIRVSPTSPQCITYHMALGKCLCDGEFFNDSLGSLRSAFSLSVKLLGRRNPHVRPIKQMFEEVLSRMGKPRPRRHSHRSNGSDARNGSDSRSRAGTGEGGADPSGVEGGHDRHGAPMEIGRAHV